MPTPLLDALSDYVKRDRERWHTPGHRGVPPLGGDFLAWTHDITEIPELWTDPTPLEQSQALMAMSYGADRTWYSVAGATVPVMAAILAAFPFGSRLYVDRAVHRSVLGALVIGGYAVDWLYPSVLMGDLPMPLTDFPSDYRQTAGLVVTRPNYDGIAGPLQSAIDAAHRQGRIVVVDEAHGSHWRGALYPQSALSFGADLVAHGVHKSQAALTGTGLLHLSGHRVSPDAVDRWWRILQSSSPSYLLLGSLDRLQWERHQPEPRAAWTGLAQAMRGLWDRLSARGFILLQPWAESAGFNVDPARLTLLGPGALWRQQLARIGTVEKVTHRSVTLFLAPGVSLDKLWDALCYLQPEPEAAPLGLKPYPKLAACLSIRDAWNHPGRWVPLEESAQRVAGAPLTPYPPGVPVVVPGEEMSDAVVEWLVDWQVSAASPIEGIRHEKGRPYVWVID